MNMPLNIDWQQILLHLLNFVVLFAVLYFLLYNPVKKFMDKRCEYYKNLDDEAKQNLSETEKAKEKYLSKLASAEKEISDIKEKAHKDIEEANSIKIRQAKEEAEKIIGDARLSAERERSKILKEAQNEISDMVASAAEKVILNSSASDVYDSFFSTVKRGESDD